MDYILILIISFFTPIVIQRGLEFLPDKWLQLWYHLIISISIPHRMSEVPSLNASRRRGSLSHKNYNADVPTRDKPSTRNLISESDTGSSLTFKNIMQNLQKRQQDYKRKYWELSPAQDLHKERMKKEEENENKNRKSKTGLEDSIIENMGRRSSQNQGSSIIEEMNESEEEKTNENRSDRDQRRNQSPVEIQTGDTTIQIYSPQGSRIVVGHNPNHSVSRVNTYPPPCYQVIDNSRSRVVGPPLPPPIPADQFLPQQRVITEWIPSGVPPQNFAHCNHFIHQNPHIQRPPSNIKPANPNLSRVIVREKPNPQSRVIVQRRPIHPNMQLQRPNSQIFHAHPQHPHLHPQNSQIRLQQHPHHVQHVQHAQQPQYPPKFVRVQQNQPHLSGIKVVNQNQPTGLQTPNFDGQKDDSKYELINPLTQKNINSKPNSQKIINKEAQKEKKPSMTQQQYETQLENQYNQHKNVQNQNCTVKKSMTNTTNITKTKTINREIIQNKTITKVINKNVGQVMYALPSGQMISPQQYQQQLLLLSQQQQLSRVQQQQLAELIQQQKMLNNSAHNHKSRSSKQLITDRTQDMLMIANQQQPITIQPQQQGFQDVQPVSHKLLSSPMGLAGSQPPIDHVLNQYDFNTPQSQKPLTFKYLPENEKQKVEQAMGRLTTMIDELTNDNEQKKVKEQLCDLKELKEQNAKQSYNYLNKMDHILNKYGWDGTKKAQIRNIKAEQSGESNIFSNIINTIKSTITSANKQNGPMFESSVSPYQNNQNTNSRVRPLSHSSSIKQFLSLSKNMIFDYQK